MEVPLKVELTKNIEPDFSIACRNTCSVNENSSKNATLIDSSRIDNDSDKIIYSLENNYDEKFIINPLTGEVSLSNELDYESKNSYELKIIATDSKNVSKEVSTTLNVLDKSYNVTDIMRKYLSSR